MQVRNHSAEDFLNASRGGHIDDTPCPRTDSMLAMQTRTCANCGKQTPRPLRRNWCQECYDRWKRLGKPASGPGEPWRPGKPRKGSGRLCSVPGCGEPHSAKGFCRRHYLADRLARHRAEVPSKKAAGMPIEYEGPITCRTCHTERPHTDFYIRPPGKFRRTDCRFCMVERARLSAERIEVADKRWMMRRDAALRRKYGITNEDFDGLIAAQEGRCAICGQIPEVARANTRTGRRWTGLQIDHDHGTGIVRGLLCIRCNTTLGHIEATGWHAFRQYLDVWDPDTRGEGAGQLQAL